MILKLVTVLVGFPCFALVFAWELATTFFGGGRGACIDWLFDANDRRTAHARREAASPRV